MVAAELPGVGAEAGEDVMVRRNHVRTAAGFIVDERRAAAVKGPVADQFGAAIRALSDAEQDSKELKSAKRSALIESVLAGIQLPFPGGGVDGGLDAITAGAVKAAVDSVYKQIVRTKIAVEKRRPDGRSETEIRPITCDVGLIPRAHGSALFTRGQTQALTLATLGTVKEEQRIDDLSLQTTKRYIHHYNFPPFSVGETGFMRGPKRRDIGHGALAERAILAVVPDTDEFPYTMRLVSEILESNGSSSMASVCGSSLALFDAGVGIKSAVAGIAMGLIKEGDDHVILTDIQGAEDHLGDMDFKVAGTPDGITALQMDIKITGVTQEIMRSALSQARDARLRILEVMNATLSEPRSEMAAHAPQVLQTQISPDQIGLLIGKGGETIRGIQDEFTVQIDVEEDGSVRIYGAGDAAVAAREHIDQMMRPMQVGDVLRERKVVKVSDFGAFVELRKGTDGLLHVSRVAPGVRIATMEQILERGAIVDVEVVEVDTDRGRIALKLVGLHEDGNVLSPQDVGERYKLAFPDGERTERPPREDGDRGDRGGRGRGRGGRDRRPAPVAALAGASRHDAAERRPGRLRGDARAPFGGARRLRRRRLARRAGRPQRDLALHRAPAVPRHRPPLGARDRADLRPLRRRAERGHLARVHRDLRARRSTRTSTRPSASSAAWCGRRRSTTSRPSATSCSRRSRCTTTRPTTSCTT